MSNQADYKKLRKVWYKKLADETDFKDIETVNGDFKSGSPNWNSESNRVTGPAKAEYYYKAFQFLHSHEFETELHKIIWAYHCEAISVAKIAELLRDAGIVKAYRKHSKPLSRPRVWQIVNAYRKVMMNERL
jgi:hypothetical protein